MSKLARDHRNAELGKIHLAKKDLCMTDEEYRAMLWSVGRVNSAKDLDYAGRHDEYADGIARQMLGADAPQFFEWLHTDALHRLSAALGVEQRRKGAPTR